MRAPDLPREVQRGALLHPPRSRILFFLLVLYTSNFEQVSSRRQARWRGQSLPGLLCQNLENITLSGGSLGSCVDEERSQLRELM